MLHDGSKCTRPEGRDPALDALGWYVENSESLTQRVKGRRPNGWGLFDLHGNVWEWCADWFADYSAEAQRDPVGPDIGHFRVVRGGSWASRARLCRAAYRVGFGAGDRDHFLGFRLAAGQGVSGARAAREVR